MAGLDSNRNTDCQLCSEDRVRKVNKNSGKLSLEEKKDLIVRSTLCYERYKSKGIGVPSDYEVKIESCEIDGQVAERVVEYATYCGETCEKIVQKEPARFSEVVFCMTQFYVPFFQPEKYDFTLDGQSFFNLGPDPHSGNACLDEEGTLVHIDFCKGRVCHEGIFYLGDIQPQDQEDYRVGRDRYYTWEGCFRRFLADCERLNPEIGRKTVLEALHELDVQSWQRAYALVESLPSSRVALTLYGQGFSAARMVYCQEVEKLKAPDDVDDARDLAAVAVFSFGQLQEFQQEILVLTHASYKITRAERIQKFEKAKRRLSEVASILAPQTVSPTP